MEIQYGNRKWTVLSYDKACIFLTPLLGNKVSDEDSQRDERGNILTSSESRIEVITEKDGVRLVQTIYNGPLEMLFNDRLSAGWVISYVDEYLDKEGMEEYISDMVIEEKCIPDGEIPRIPEWYVHDVNVMQGDRNPMDIRYDPCK